MFHKILQIFGERSSVILVYAQLGACNQREEGACAGCDSSLVDTRSADCV
jgi:hypothetical protein